MITPFSVPALFGSQGPDVAPLSLVMQPSNFNFDPLTFPTDSPIEPLPISLALIALITLHSYNTAIPAIFECSIGGSASSALSSMVAGKLPASVLTVPVLFKIHQWAPVVACAAEAPKAIT